MTAVAQPLWLTLCMREHANSLISNVFAYMSRYIWLTIIEHRHSTTTMYGIDNMKISVNYTYFPFYQESLGVTNYYLLFVHCLSSCGD